MRMSNCPDLTTLVYRQRTMNLRDAAALVLVGWILMSPPMRGTEIAPIIDMRASLDEWDVEGSYDSAAACAKAQRENLRVSAANEWAIPEQRKLSVYKAAWAICVATDDPRLK
jgi:hypothetical protein